MRKKLSEETKILVKYLAVKAGHAGEVDDYGNIWRGSSKKRTVTKGFFWNKRKVEEDVEDKEIIIDIFSLLKEAVGVDFDLEAIIHSAVAGRLSGTNRGILSE